MNGTFSQGQPHLVYISGLSITEKVGIGHTYIRSQIYLGFDSKIKESGIRDLVTEIDIGGF